MTNKLKTHARALARKSGMSYQAARNAITRAPGQSAVPNEVAFESLESTEMTDPVKPWRDSQLALKASTDAAIAMMADPLKPWRHSQLALKASTDAAIAMMTDPLKPWRHSQLALKASTDAAIAMMTDPLKPWRHSQLALKLMR